jgi:hypothetical protein
MYFPTRAYKQSATTAEARVVAIARYFIILL